MIPKAYKSYIIENITRWKIKIQIFQAILLGKKIEYLSFDDKWYIHPEPWRILDPDPSRYRIKTVKKKTKIK